MNFFLFKPVLQAQTPACSNDDLASKYWQYRETLYRHFIAIDRSPSGCINDGIGQDSTDPCICSKAGMSLPATSITMSGNGAGSDGFSDRSIAYDEYIANPQLYPFYDPDCGKLNNGKKDDPVDWTGNGKKNHLDVGSETPHQMGWYWVTLATEYELLGRNGQTAAQQRTLEELFLALQAYRRLDIQAQCIVKNRYDEIANNFEVETCTTFDIGPSPLGASYTILGNNGMPYIQGDCLCSERYRTGHHKHFDTPCWDDCDWEPQTDGYSGFFVREDATQNLEVLLHDTSEQKWNIDLVTSDFAFSMTPPCTASISQACYLVHRQNFVSHDQLLGLMMGLSFIKRYIPENATVYTCNGNHYKPFEIAQKIAWGLVNLGNNLERRINWPGAKGCCAKEAHLSSGAGGNMLFTFAGIVDMYEYISGESFPQLGYIDDVLYEILPIHGNDLMTKNANLKLKSLAIGKDLGEKSNGKQRRFIESCYAQHKEIFILMNNLLYPAGGSLDTDQDFFKNMLCGAPCGGPCRKAADYGTASLFNPVFPCSNTPDWMGQRWESTLNNRPDGSHPKDASFYARQFNGLDYMMLFNLYQLHYNQITPYYNPDFFAQGNAGLDPDKYIGDNRILGPSRLCIGATGNYNLSLPVGYTLDLPPFWSVSNSLQLADPKVFTAEATAVYQMNPDYIQAEFSARRDIAQYYRGLLNTNSSGAIDSIPDVCTFSYQKPIEIGDVYAIQADINHCLCYHEFHALGTDNAETTYEWEISQYGDPNPTPILLSGKDVTYTGCLPGNAQGGTLLIVLKVSSACGVTHITDVKEYSCTGESTHNLVIQPNPANTTISVGLTNDFQYPNQGINVRIIRSDLGTIQYNGSMYQNGTQINVSGLPNGAYQVRADLGNNQIVNGQLIISRD